MDSITWAVHDLRINDKLAKLLMQHENYSKYNRSFTGVDVFEEYRDDENKFFETAHTILSSVKEADKNAYHTSHLITRKEKIFPNGGDFLGFKSMPAVFKTVKYAGYDESVMIDGYIKIPTSHYEVHFLIQEKQNRILFDMSVPKFLYGNNIVQMCDNPHGKLFNSIMSKDFKKQFRKMFDKVFKYIQFFFESRFGMLGIFDKEEYKVLLFRSIEILRFDLCFNQYFPSKQDALEYLEICKKSRQKNARGLGNSRETTDLKREKTGLYELNTSSYAKIYHKGTEYNKNDRKKHVKINSVLAREGKAQIPVHIYQAEADKILRYEMKFGKVKLQNKYNTRVFRNKCAVHKAMLKYYRNLNSRSKSGSNLENLSRKERADYKKIKKTKTFARSFFLSLPSVAVEMNKISNVVTKDRIEGEKKVLFNRELWNLCVDEFYDFVKKYMVVEQDSVEEMIEKVTDFNNSVKDRKKMFSKDGLKAMDKTFKKNNDLVEVKIGSLLMLFKFLQIYSWDEVSEMGFMHRNTMSNYKRILNKAGISASGIQKKIMFRPTMDFGAYYDSLASPHFQGKNIHKKIGLLNYASARVKDIF